MLVLKDVSKPKLCFNTDVSKNSKINFFSKEPTTSHVFWGGFFYQDTGQGWRIIQLCGSES